MFMYMHGKEISNCLIIHDDSIRFGFGNIKCWLYFERISTQTVDYQLLEMYSKEIKSNEIMCC